MGDGGNMKHTFWSQLKLTRPFWDLGKWEEKNLESWVIAKVPTLLAGPTFGTNGSSRWHP